MSAKAVDTLCAKRMNVSEWKILEKSLPMPILQMGISRPREEEINFQGHAIG